MTKTCVLIVGDIGGTNARLQLLYYNRNQTLLIPSIVYITRRTYRTNRFTGLTTILEGFLNDIENEQHEEDVRNAIKNKKYEYVCKANRRLSHFFVVFEWF